VQGPLGERFARVAKVFVAQLEGGRDIDIADASPEALDISEATLAKTIIEQEQERLAIETLRALDSQHHLAAAQLAATVAAAKNSLGSA
jgi:hypothetical protein